jgi:hypothetical protein
MFMAGRMPDSIGCCPSCVYCAELEIADGDWKLTRLSFAAFLRA